MLAAGRGREKIPNRARSFDAARAIEMARAAEPGAMVRACPLATASPSRAHYGHARDTHPRRVELLDERLAWHPEGATDPFELDLAAFFTRVDEDA